MANEAMRENWQVGGEAWVGNARIFDHVYQAVTAEVLGAAAIAAGQRVLDVGCGYGTLLAAVTGAGAEAVGVDISEPMIAAARSRVPAASVLVADAQTTDLAGLGPFDRVISRFGVMFFDDPVAAFANIRRATVPGGRLAFACWRPEEEDAFSLGLAPLRARLPDNALPAPQVGEPGPLGLADPDRVGEVLTAAGWADVHLEPVDAPADYGLDGSDGVEQRLQVALAGSVGRKVRELLEPEIGADGWDAVIDEIRADLDARRGDGPVGGVARIWIVTASNPG